MTAKRTKVAENYTKSFRIKLSKTYGSLNCMNPV